MNSVSRNLGWAICALGCALLPTKNWKVKHRGEIEGKGDSLRTISDFFGAMRLSLCGGKKKYFSPTAEERIREFLIYCNDLERHPFFSAHLNEGTLSSGWSFGSSGTSSHLSFDVIHLESFLCRLRQFLFRNELFFYKDLRQAVVAMFGTDKEFQSRYDKLVRQFVKKFDGMNVAAFKSDGSDAISGFTVNQLIEARLYTGAIHSEQRLSAPKGSATAGLATAHPIVKDHLDLTLAYAALMTAQNIFAFRHNLLSIARKRNMVSSLPEMSDLDERNRSAGT